MRNHRRFISRQYITGAGARTYRITRLQIYYNYTPRYSTLGLFITSLAFSRAHLLHLCFPCNATATRPILVQFYQIGPKPQCLRDTRKGRVNLSAEERVGNAFNNYDDFNEFRETENGKYKDKDKDKGKGKNRRKVCDLLGKPRLNFTRAVFIRRIYSPYLFAVFIRRIYSPG
jgi:hypothetical protein